MPRIGCASGMKGLFLDFVVGWGGQWDRRVFFWFRHGWRLLGALPSFRSITWLRPVLDFQHVILHAVAKAIGITTGVLREKRSMIFGMMIQTYRLLDQPLARL